jgi:hypothetical protein
MPAPDRVPPSRVLAQPHSRGRRACLVVIGATAAALAASAVTGCGNHVRASSTEAADTTLLRAAKIADRLSTAGGYPFSTSLATQLHLSDPARVYEPLSSPAQVAARGSIGVYATASTLWLNKRAAGGLVIQLRRVLRGADRGTYGPSAITPSGLADGDFVTPLNETWTIQAGRLAQVARDPHVSAQTPGSLRVDGTGRRGRVPTLVYQEVATLASRAPGTIYTVDLVARSRSLSRRLSVETKIDYRDGSHEFFVATPQGAQSAAGVPPGSSRGWIPLESRAIAHKRVAALTIYAVDTGVLPLRGSAWIDDVTLAIARP